MSLETNIIPRDYSASISGRNRLRDKQQFAQEAGNGLMGLLSQDGWTGSAKTVYDSSGKTDEQGKPLKVGETDNPVGWLADGIAGFFTKHLAARAAQAKGEVAIPGARVDKQI